MAFGDDEKLQSASPRCARQAASFCAARVKQRPSAQRAPPEPKWPLISSASACRNAKTKNELGAGCEPGRCRRKAARGTTTPPAHSWRVAAAHSFSLRLLAAGVRHRDVAPRRARARAIPSLSPRLPQTSSAAPACRKLRKDKKRPERGSTAAAPTAKQRAQPLRDGAMGAACGQRRTSIVCSLQAPSLCAARTTVASPRSRRRPPQQTFADAQKQKTSN